MSICSDSSQGSQGSRSRDLIKQLQRRRSLKSDSMHTAVAESQQSPTQKTVLDIGSDRKLPAQNAKPRVLVAPPMTVADELAARAKSKKDKNNCQAIIADSTVKRVDSASLTSKSRRNSTSLNNKVYNFAEDPRLISLKNESRNLIRDQPVETWDGNGGLKMRSSYITGNAAAPVSPSKRSLFGSDRLRDDECSSQDTQSLPEQLISIKHNHVNIWELVDTTVAPKIEIEKLTKEVPVNFKIDLFIKFEHLSFVPTYCRYSILIFYLKVHRFWNSLILLEVMNYSLLAKLSLLHKTDFTQFPPISFVRQTVKRRF